MRGLEPVSWFLLIMLALRLIPNMEECSSPAIDVEKHTLEEPCKEFYEVRQGETLPS